MTLTKENYFNALFDYISQDLGANSPFEPSEVFDNFVEKWLPDTDKHPEKISEYNDQYSDLITVHYSAMRRAFEVGFDVANEINRK